jgi:hypothetical protein
MNVPDKKHHQQDWNDRDLREILSLARQMRVQGALTDRSAWRAAEETYVSTQASNHRKGQLHARL